MSVLDSANMQVSPQLDWLGRMVGHHPRLWIRLGNFESWLLAADLETVAVEKPVYICGLARAGSTVLLEALAGRPGVATHRYCDFPFLFTPYWWNLLLKFTPRRAAPKRERAHGDGILVNRDSPEAMEEMLWRAFAEGSTDFAPFYRDHIRKLLLIRKAQRYAAKNNNVTHIPALARLFPDARFIIPVREPVSHIGSLMRQHERFCAAGRKDAKVVTHMSLAGHFEFGLNRAAIYTGPETGQVTAAWERGDEVRGWALYWDAIYRFARTQAAENVLFMRFEELCQKPAETLRAVFAHAELAIDEHSLHALSAAIRAPDYYAPSFSEKDLRRIREVTQETARGLGY